jgi:hypothetical protein
VTTNKEEKQDVFLEPFRIWKEERKCDT